MMNLVYQLISLTKTVQLKEQEKSIMQSQMVILLNSSMLLLFLLRFVERQILMV